MTRLTYDMWRPDIVLCDSPDRGGSKSKYDESRPGGVQHFVDQVISSSDGLAQAAAKAYK